REPGIGEVHEDALGTLALNVDLFYARYVKEALPQSLRFAGEFSRRHAMSLEGVHREDDIRVLVVDKRALYTGGKSGSLITEFLARLIELLSNRGGWGLVTQRDHHHCDARAREGLHTIVPTQLLHSLFQRLGDEVLHLLGCRPGPHGGGRQSLDQERRILGATEVQEGVRAGQNDRDDQEKGDR